MSAARFPAKTGKKRKNAPHCSEVPLQHPPSIFGADVKNNPPVTLTTEEACPPPIGGERLSTPKKGAEREDRGGALENKKGVRTSGQEESFSFEGFWWETSPRTCRASIPLVEVVSTRCTLVVGAV